VGEGRRKETKEKGGEGRQEERGGRKETRGGGKEKRGGRKEQRDGRRLPPVLPLLDHTHKYESFCTFYFLSELFWGFLKQIMDFAFYIMLEWGIF